MSEVDARYPVGRFVFVPPASSAERAARVQEIRGLAGELGEAVAGLSEAAWDTRYRPGGWTVRQVVHHLPDSHLNAYTRFKLALTEDEPTIKPYDEARWAELADTRATPPEVSLILLDALHQRWVVLLESMAEAEFARALRHPEHRRTLTLDEMLALYAWHGRHHVAHVRAVRDTATRR